MPGCDQNFRAPMPFPAVLINLTLSVCDPAGPPCEWLYRHSVKRKDAEPDPSKRLRNLERQEGTTIVKIGT